MTSPSISKSPDLRLQCYHPTLSHPKSTQILQCATVNLGHGSAILRQTTTLLHETRHITSAPRFPRHGTSAAQIPYISLKGAKLKGEEAMWEAVCNTIGTSNQHEILDLSCHSDVINSFYKTKPSKVYTVFSFSPFDSAKPHSCPVELPHWWCWQGLLEAFVGPVV